MKTRLFTLFIVLGLVLSACGGTPAATSEPSSPATEPAAATEPPVSESDGGTVTFVISEEPAGLNRYLADAAIVRQVSDATIIGLTEPNENGEYQPRLAADLPAISEDRTTVTWTLREGLKWSDGEPLTSDDIVYTWEVISNPDSGAFNATSGFDLIESIETPDDLTAVVKYSEPYVDYLGQFSAGILPRHATGAPEEMATWEWNMTPVGAGPFVVTAWQSGESITMEANPNYYEEGKPYLDRLIFRIAPEPAAQTALMISGEGQVHLWPSEDKADYDPLMEGKAEQVLVPGLWNMAIDFNLSKPGDDDPGASAPHPILGDLRVRQAISHAIDYDGLINDVLNAQVASSTSPFAYGWYKCEIPRMYSFDAEKAKQLLTEAGWVEGSDGIRVAQGAMHAEDGTRLSLELQGYTGYEPLERVEQFIVENLKAVGVEANIVNYDYSIIFGSYADGSPRKIGDYDMLIYDRSYGIEPHGTVVIDYLSTNIPTADNPDGDNHYRWVNPDADQAIETAGSTFDQSVRREAYCELGKLIQEDAVQNYIFLWQDGYGFSTDLTGYVVSTWGSMTWDIQNWKYK
ncbi:MAG TPA: peptide ABC transporter substrate-binding protein [Anaerolineales bacterium]|nr:peptide ABC transporter substrate-binding protein [Anaerolineales bacterium]